MQLTLKHTDDMEIALYNLAGRYHGFTENVATRMSEFGNRVRPTALRQAINPNYAERPSFVTRTAGFFIAWVVLHPRSGVRALYTFVAFILQHAPNGNVKEQISVLEMQVKEVSAKVDEVQAAIDAIPQVRLDCREYVRKRRTKQSGRLKQPTL